MGREKERKLRREHYIDFNVGWTIGLWDTGNLIVLSIGDRR